MGAHVTTWPIAAVCLPFEALPDLQAQNTNTTLTSAFTEDEPGPGLAVPTDGELGQLEPELSGAQDVAVDLRVLRGGAPEVSATGHGCEIGYSLDATTTVRGWSPPNLLTGWVHVDWTTTQNFSKHDVVTNVESQRVVCLYCDSSAVGQPVKSRTFDPLQNGGGASAVTITTATPDAVSGASWEGSVYALIHETTSSEVWRSDDDGATWVLHAEDPLPTATTAINTAALDIGPTGAVYITTDGNDLFQYVSHDLLGSLDEVDSIAGSHPRIARLPDGTFVVAYIRASDSFPCVRRLSSAGARLSDADVIAVQSAATVTQALAVDPDGLLWWIGATSGSAHRLQVAVSDDGGLTWSFLLTEGPKVSDTNADYCENIRATSAYGQVFLQHQWNSGEATDNSLALMGLGGWGCVTSGAIYDTAAGAARKDAIVNRSGSGQRTGSGAVDRQSWVPIERPGNAGWTATGAGTDSSGTGELVISTTASLRRFHLAWSDQSDECAAIVELRQVSGGSVTTEDIAVSVRSGQVSGGDFEVAVRVSGSQIRVVDAATGTTLATQAYVTASLFQLAIAVWDNDAFVAVRQPWDPRWSLVWQGTLSAGGASTALARVMWGHITASTAESRWRLVSVSQRLMFGVEETGLFYDRVLGRPVGSRPVPLPEVGGSAACTWIALRGGVGARLETYRVAPLSRFPLRSIYPTLSRSPAEIWRTQADGTQWITWTTALESSWLGDAIALFAANCNFATANLQYYTGSAWVTAATIDLTTGFQGLDYQLHGDCLTPGAGTLSGARWVQENELAGGYAWLGSEVVVRRIRGNTAGAWLSPGGASTPLVRIFLEGCDGTEPTSDECDLVWPQGVVVVHRTSLTTADYWRLHVPAGQPTLDGKYSAGLLAPFEVLAFGAPPDWGWSRETAPNVESRTTRRGVRHARQLGPALESWTFGWPEGMPLDRHRQGIDLDYVGVGSALPLATVNDVAWRLRGLLERGQAGASPVLALTDLPASGTTITDRTRFLYGGLEGSVRISHVSGDEGVNELVRVDSITVRAIP